MYVGEFGYKHTWHLQPLNRTGRECLLSSRSDLICDIERDTSIAFICIYVIIYHIYIYKSMIFFD